MIWINILHYVKYISSLPDVYNTMTHLYVSVTTGDTGRYFIIRLFLENRTHGDIVAYVNIMQIHTASSHRYNGEFNQPGALFTFYFQWWHNVGDVNHSNCVLKVFRNIHHTPIALKVWRMLSYESKFVGTLVVCEENVLKSTKGKSDDRAEKKICWN